MQHSMLRGAAVIAAVLAARAFRTEDPALFESEDGDSAPPGRGWASLVAVGEDMDAYRAAVEANAQRAAVAAKFMANRSRTRATPPCPWKDHLTADGVEVGSGSYGQVYVAKVACDGATPVAIKKMKGTTEKKVHGEAKMMDKFAWSPNFVKAYGAGKSLIKNSNVQYILMEAASGGTFEKYLGALKYDPDHKRFNTAVKLWLEMVDGVREMHANGYIHRDLKPENILVSASCSSGNCHAKVADLGLACPVTVCRDTAGTPYFLAPELVTYGIIHRKNDVWALGLMLYMVLNQGALPQKLFEAKTVPLLVEQIKVFGVTRQPEYRGLPDANGLKELMTHMLALDHNERWDAETSLNFALEKLRGCHRTGQAPLCAEDPTKKVSELPACWAGDVMSAWVPEKAKEVERPVVAEPVFDRQESLYTEEKLQEASEQGVDDAESVFFEGDHTETMTVKANEALGCLIDDDGTIVDWGQEDGTQAKDLGLDLGWIVFMVAGEPFSPETFAQALAGEKGDTFEVIFKVPQDFGGNSIGPGLDALDEDDTEDQVEPDSGMKVSIRVYTVKRPGNTIATNFLFREDHVGQDGVVLPAWGAKKTKNYVKAWPLMVGDKIMKVNDVEWEIGFDNADWKKKAKAGLLGALKIEYMRPSK